LSYRGPTARVAAGVQRHTADAGGLDAGAILARPPHGGGRGVDRSTEDPDPGVAAPDHPVRVAAVPPDSERYRGVLQTRVETTTRRIQSDQRCHDMLLMRSMDKTDVCATSNCGCAAT